MVYSFDVIQKNETQWIENDKIMQKHNQYDTKSS